MLNILYYRDGQLFRPQGNDYAPRTSAAAVSGRVTPVTQPNFNADVNEKPPGGWFDRQETRVEVCS
jgi:hypothetical protein